MANRWTGTAPHCREGIDLSEYAGYPQIWLRFLLSTEPLGNGQRSVEVDMTLTAPGCGMGDVLVMDVKDKLEIIPTIREARVELTFDPPWNRDMMSEAARLQTGMY